MFSSFPTGSRRSRALRPSVAAMLSGMLIFAGASLAAAPARADSAPLDAGNPATPPTVAADALPTVQINGVVWSQVVVGNTVYAAGSFTRVRPAGAAAGTQETVRNNLLAYDIRTGQLITSFAPNLNAQAHVVTASPDGSRIYVGGDFTTADGQPRYRVAAYSTATGALLNDFQPAVGASVEAIAATASAVYVGGIDWGSAGGAARNYLAAFSATSGAVLPWAPVANDEIGSLAVVNGGSAVVIAGHLTSLNGSTVNGLGEVDATTGKNLPFTASTATENGGLDSGFTALSTDGDTVYATGYSWNGSGNLEGMIAVNPSGGAVRWVDDCHGDSYSVYATGSVEYVAGHAHDCSNIGGFPQDNPDNNAASHYRAIAFSKAATGTVGTVTGNFIGKPAPSQLNWFPALTEGTYTGLSQGPWSVAGNGNYVVYGGEFPTVNGTAQQGLVRFAVPSIAPNKVGPDGDRMTAPALRSWSSGTVRVTFQTTSDQDNQTLRYDVYRSDKPGAPVGSVTASSTFWNRPTVTFTDSTAPAGKSVSYHVTGVDPFGNATTGPSATVTVATATVGGTTPDSYSQAVLADSPGDYWRLGEGSGTTSYDQAGMSDLALSSGVSLGKPGALTGRPNTAAAFNGTASGIAATQTAISAPNVFSEEAWFSTTSTTGGKLLGFGSAKTGLSSSYDRSVTLDGSGRVTFGVWTGQAKTIRSATGYNNGKWHHVVGMMSSAGLAMYLDGKLVGTDPSTTSAHPITGYWRLGGDKTWDGTGPYLAATVDEVAIYPVALSATQVANHYKAGTTATANTAPTAAFASSVSGLAVSVDGSGSTDPDGAVASWAWDFGDGATGAGKTASHTYAAAGTYTVKLTVTDGAGATGTVSRAVTVAAPAPVPGGALASDAFGRTVTGGWGAADAGGTWTVAGTVANASVGNGSGGLVAAKGGWIATDLPISAQDVAVQADVSLTAAPTGGGTYVNLGGRNTGGNQYNAQLWFASDGTAELSLLSVVSGAEKELGSFALAGKYTVGSALRVRLDLSGTTLHAKAWPASAAEPAGWQLTATDSTAALQKAGGLEVQLYQSSSATTTQTVRVDNLWAGAAGTTPAQ